MAGTFFVFCFLLCTCKEHTYIMQQLSERFTSYPSHQNLEIRNLVLIVLSPSKQKSQGVTNKIFTVDSGVSPSSAKGNIY